MPTEIGKVNYVAECVDLIASAKAGDPWRVAVSAIGVAA